MQEIIIAHAADLHLRGFSAGGKSDYDAEGIECFAALTGFCAKHKIPFLSLAGDIFDTATPDPANLADFAALLWEMPETRIHLVPGNHDPYQKDGFWAAMEAQDFASLTDDSRSRPASLMPELPPNCSLSRPGGTRLHYKDLGLSLWSAPFVSRYAEESLLDELKPKPQPNHINLGILHGEYMRRPGPSHYNPITEAWLEKSGLDLLLLGHIHKNGGLAALNKISPLAPVEYGGFYFDGPGVWQALDPQTGYTQNPPKLYSGFPRARGYDEPGLGGFRLLYLCKGKDFFSVREKFVPLLTPVSRHYFQLDLETADKDFPNPADAANFLKDMAEAQIAADFAHNGLEREPKQRERDSLSIKLSGRVRSKWPVEAIARIMSRSYAEVRIEDLTRPDYNEAVLLNEASIRGEILRLLKAYKEQNSPSKQLPAGEKTPGEIAEPAALAEIWPESAELPPSEVEEILELVAELIMRAAEGAFEADEFYAKALELSDYGEN